MPASTARPIGRGDEGGREHPRDAARRPGQEGAPLAAGEPDEEAVGVGRGVLVRLDAVTPGGSRGHARPRYVAPSASATEFRPASRTGADRAVPERYFAQRRSRRGGGSTTQVSPTAMSPDTRTRRMVPARSCRARAAPGRSRRRGCGTAPPCGRPRAGPRRPRTRVPGRVGTPPWLRVTLRRVPSGGTGAPEALGGLGELGGRLHADVPVPGAVVSVADEAGARLGVHPIGGRASAADGPWPRGSPPRPGAPRRDGRPGCGAAALGWSPAARLVPAARFPRLAHPAILPESGAEVVAGAATRHPTRAGRGRSRSLGACCGPP